MEPHALDAIAETLRGTPPLPSSRQETITELLGLSRDFAAVAGCTPPPCDTVSASLLVLESGHQPNFLPYPGIWRKAWLLDRLRQRCREQGTPAIAFWGFADQNLGTAPVLFRNQVPALKKSGSESIGFPRQEGPERMKCFNRLPRPDEEVWDREKEKIARLYTKNPRIDAVLRIMDEAWGRSDSLADVNACVFARICTEIFGLSLCFFMHSEAISAGIGEAASRLICSDIGHYAAIYNRVAADAGLPPVPAGHVPFWYHCPCGGKLPLTVIAPELAGGACPVCGTVHEAALAAKGFAGWTGRRGFTSVTRDVVMGDTLFDALFISGAGGSLAYGKISRAVADAFSLHRPVTLAWASRDYYLGRAHRAALQDLERACGTGVPALLRGAGAGAGAALAREREEIRCRNDCDQREMRRLLNECARKETAVATVRGVFATMPSFIDLLAMLDPEEIRAAWEQALGTAQVEATAEGAFLLRQDVCYPTEGDDSIGCDDLVRLYAAVRDLGGDE
ncbi:MAG: hypothetical protein JXA08_09480 [Methanomicrobiaceae archaeon]|nr:hypothetical protein [Methanomicrobiaceae archaeon]